MFGLSSFAATPFASLASLNIAVTLTGVVSSGNVGTVSVAARSFALTGNSATGNVGTVSVGARTFSLTGLSSSGDAGYVLGLSSKAITGVGAVGNVSDEISSQGITGNAASGAVGTVSAVYWNTIVTTEDAGWILIKTE
jgi:hypothetical protein